MEEEKKEQELSVPKSRRDSVLRVIGIVLCCLAVLGLVLLGVYHAVLDHYLDKLNIVTGKEELSFVTERLTDELPETLTETETEEVPLEGVLNADNLPLICDTKHVQNVLLMATDGRVAGGAGRSDVMMLVSINRQTGKILLCSFLRDLYAHYPTEPENIINGGYDKLNHAHAYGGPELTLAVLKETFNLDVKYYAKVDFYDFIQVIDAVGGVDLYLTADEVAFLNDMERNLGLELKSLSYTPSPLPVQEGVHHLNGVKALCHARNRTLGSDWARTQRQRAIITALMEKAKGLGLNQINNLLNTVLPLVTTNMPKDLIKDLIGDMPAMIGYEIESTKIPQEGTYTSINYNMVPNLKENCDYLYEKIYGVKPIAAP